MMEMHLRENQIIVLHHLLSVLQLLSWRRSSLTPPLFVPRDCSHQALT